MARAKSVLPSATDGTIRRLESKEFQSVDEVDVEQLRRGAIVRVVTNGITYLIEKSKEACRVHIYKVPENGGQGGGYQGKMNIQPKLRVGYNMIYGQGAGGAVSSPGVLAIGLARN
jgi:homoserine dehydrogenase